MKDIDFAEMRTITMCVCITVVLCFLVFNARSCSTENKFLSTEDIKMCGLACHSGVASVTVDKCLCK